MPTTYTSLLGLALPATGELSGTWGTVVNTEITSLLDMAVAGTTTLSTDADVTLSTTTGAANQARQAIILWTANGTVTRNITAPAASKTYVVINASAGTQSIVFRGVGPTAGVTIVKGESAVVAWNGSDFIKVSNTSGAGAFTNLSVSGTTTLSGLTASTALALDASKNVVSVTNTGTGNNVLATSPVLTTPNLGTPSAATLTNATDLPVSTGISGLGTGVATALAVNTGAAGAFVVNGGALGTPSSGTVTNLTGTAAININGTVGATTPNTGAFTTLSASGVATFSAGTAAAPALARATDTGTGMWFPAAGTVAWSTVGFERFRVSSTGMLIGTTTNTNSSALVANGTISEAVSSVQYLVASQFDVGTAPNQIPLTQYLGNLAFTDAEGLVLPNLTVRDDTGIPLLTVNSTGGFAFRGGTVAAAQTGYTTPANLTTDRTFDANATTVDELADVLGTLIQDLKAKGIIAA